MMSRSPDLAIFVVTSEQKDTQTDRWTKPIALPLVHARVVIRVFCNIYPLNWHSDSDRITDIIGCDDDDLYQSNCNLIMWTTYTCTFIHVSTVNLP